MAAMAAHPPSVIHGQPPVPYLGSKISLISKSDMRYEGILYTVDTEKATIALAKVRSFGTEQRSEKEVSGQNEVYEFIIFKASDIKDLTVLETPKAFPSLLMTGPPHDPAILQTGAPTSQHEADNLKLQKKRLAQLCDEADGEIFDLKKTIALQNDKIRAMSSAGLNGAASNSGIGQFMGPSVFPNITEMMRMMSSPGPDLVGDVAVSIATSLPLISAPTAITTSAKSIGGAATGLPPGDVLSLALPSQQIGTCNSGQIGNRRPFFDRMQLHENVQHPFETRNNNQQRSFPFNLGAGNFNHRSNAQQQHDNSSFCNKDDAFLVFDNRVGSPDGFRPRSQSFTRGRFPGNNAIGQHPPPFGRQINFNSNRSMMDSQHNSSSGMMFNNRFSLPRGRGGFRGGMSMSPSSGCFGGGRGRGSSIFAQPRGSADAGSDFFMPPPPPHFFGGRGGVGGFAPPFGSGGFHPRGVMRGAFRGGRVLSRGHHYSNSTGIPNRSNQDRSATAAKMDDYDFEEANTKFQETFVRVKENKFMDDIKKEDGVDDSKLVNTSSLEDGEFDESKESVDKPRDVATTEADSQLDTKVGLDHVSSGIKKCYDKDKSFFDRISCDMFEKLHEKTVHAQRNAWFRERHLNQETFGFHPPAGFFNRGRGGGNFFGYGGGRGNFPPQGFRHRGGFRPFNFLPRGGFYGFAPRRGGFFGSRRGAIFANR